MSFDPAQESSPALSNRDLTMSAEEIPVPAATTPAPPVWRRWLVHAIKIVVAFGLLALLVRTIQIAALRDAISNATPGWVVAAFALAPINVLLQIQRWRTAIRGEMPDVTFRTTGASFLGGVSLGLLTPGRVGEIGRVFLLNPPSRMRLAGLHVLDKMYFMAALACFGPLMLVLMPGFIDLIAPTLLWPVLGVVSVLPLLWIVLALTPVPLRGLLHLISRRVTLKGSPAQLFKTLDRVSLRDSRVMAGLTTAQFGIILTQFQLVSLAFQPVHWVTAAHTYLASLFVKTLLPISFGDLGVSEWAAVGFYQRYGIAETTGFSASLLLFVMNILLPSLLGLIVLQRVKAGDIVGRMSRRLWRTR